jgi:very-short-patch-repair endonuclease
VKVPHCVDFIFIFENELHIVEIDSPSHYARPDHSGKWVADEETYATNLQVERYLYSQGYKVHRLSSREILNASESELIELVIDALGMSPSHFKPKLLAPH